MCGLAGFARHPNAPAVDQALAVAETLLREMGSRGRDATGVATVGGSQAFVWKWARPVDFVLSSPQWQEQRGKVTPDTLVLIGHTRHATQNNAHQDDAAHPFRMGQVCGAHNGIIRNWLELAREFETGSGRDAWIVDSQAAFALLDKFENPADALGRLDGYWALTWTKGGSLFFTRAGAPLAVAYVPELLTMFWCSEMPKLTRALDAAGLRGKYEAWEAKGETLYEYDPRKFTAEGTTAVKTELKLNRRDTRLDPRTSGRSGAPVAVQQGLDDRYPWDQIPGGFSTRGPVDPNPGDDGRQQRRRKGGKGHQGARGAAARTEDLDTSQGVSLNGLARLVKRLADRVTELEVSENLMRSQIQALQQENAYLYEVLNEANILDGPAERLVYCGTCGEGPEAGELVGDGEGGLVHSACLFAEQNADRTALAVVN